MNKEIPATIAIVLTFVAFIPYVRSILRGQTKPHVFSWLIWGLASVIVFLAQLAEGAGIGAWSIGISGVLALYIAFLAYQHQADGGITRPDWVFFFLAMASLPLWYLTRNPFWAVIILTLVDTLGFGPTFRKAYRAPYEEQLLLYIFMTLSNLTSIAALERYTWTTILFPAVVSANCVIFIAIVMIRRKSIMISGGRN